MHLPLICKLYYASYSLPQNTVNHYINQELILRLTRNYTHLCSPKLVAQAYNRVTMPKKLTVEILLDNETTYLTDYVTI